MQKISRRNFVKSAASAGAFMILPACVSHKKALANGKVNVAVVGAGGRGSASVRNIAKLPNARLIGLCDVDDERAAKIYSEFPDIKKFHDFRKMFDALDGELDAVAADFMALSPS